MADTKPKSLQMLWIIIYISLDTKNHVALLEQNASINIVEYARLCQITDTV